MSKMIDYGINMNASQAISALNKFGGRALQAAQQMNKMKRESDAAAAKLALLSQKGIMAASKGLRVMQKEGAKAPTFFSRLKSEVTGMAGSMFGAMAAISLIQRGLQDIIQTVNKGVKQFRYFNNSMHEVMTIIDDVSSNFTQFSVAISGFSKKFGKDANDLARGMYDILSSAIDSSDALFVLYTASKSAVAGLSDVSQSVDILTSLMKSYGFTAEQLVHVNDVLFQGVIRGRFTYEKLESAMGYLVPIASQVGIEFEELMAVMTTATRKGQHLDMVSRGLALAIQNIIKPSEQARKAAEELGVDLSLAALRSEGLIGFLRRINEATDDNAALFSKLIPNMRSYRVVMTLAGQGIEEATGDLDLMKTSLDKADEAFMKMAGSAKMAKDVTTQVANEASRGIGEAFADLDIELQKLDIMKKSWIQQFFGGMFDVSTYTDRMGDAPGGKGFEQLGYDLKGGFLGAMNILSLGLGEALVKKGEVDKVIDDQIEAYTKEWNKQVKGMDVDLEKTSVKKTPFEILKEGGELDFSEMEKARDTYEGLLTAWQWQGEKLGAMTLKGEDTSKLEIQFQDLTNRVMEAREAYSYWEGAIDSAEQAVEHHSESIDIIIQRMDELKDSIGAVGNMYDGELGKQLKVAEASKVLGDMQHYIRLATEDSKYETELAGKGFEWYDGKVASAIKTIRAYEKAQKEATDAQKEFNFALARNRIETMKLQLMGMMRRRGNTRAELRKLKQLSMQRTEIQIEEAEKELEAELNKNEGIAESQDTSYTDAKNLIDSMLRDEEHKVWTLKDSRQEDIDNLRETITAQEEMYMTYAGNVQTAYDNMELAMDAHLTLVKAKFGEESLEVQTLASDYETLRELQSGTMSEQIAQGVQNRMALKSGVDSMESKLLGQIPEGRLKDMMSLPFQRVRERLGFARGTNYVGSTGMYMLHKGESVSPSNRTTNGDTIVNVNVTGNTITTENTDAIAKQIADQVQKGLMNAKTGKTKYRMR